MSEPINDFWNELPNPLKPTTAYDSLVDQLFQQRDYLVEDNRRLRERIERLESWIESLEVLEQHSGILPDREWFGSEIGYLRKGEAVYKGEAKP